MYKYTCIILFASIMSICSCNFGRKTSGEQPDNQTATLSINLEKTDSLPKVSLTVINEPLTPKSSKMVLQFTNNTDSVVDTGDWYKIETLSDSDEWTEVDLKNVIFPLVAYTIPPGESTEFDIFLYPTMIKYPPGQYRVWKEVIIHGNKEYYNAPFDIK